VRACPNIVDLTIAADISSGDNEEKKVLQSIILTTSNLQALVLTLADINQGTFQAIAQRSAKLEFFGLNDFYHDAVENEMRFLGAIAAAAPKLRRLSACVDDSIPHDVSNFWQGLRPGLTVVNNELSPFWQKYLMKYDGEE
jgi:hypothetical protein